MVEALEGTHPPSARTERSIEPCKDADFCPANISAAGAVSAAMAFVAQSVSAQCSELEEITAPSHQLAREPHTPTNNQQPSATQCPSLLPLALPVIPPPWLATPLPLPSP